MKRAKESIASNLGYVERRYFNIWKIIDDRWTLQLHTPIHAAACYLNPAFHYEREIMEDTKLKHGCFEFIYKVAPMETRMDIIEEVRNFSNARSYFGKEYAILSRKVLPPGNLLLFIFFT